MAAKLLSKYERLRGCGVVNIDEMTLFVAAVGAGSISGGAREAGISLSSASRRLTSLEQRLGVRLALRTSRALVLTDMGRAYYTAAQSLLAQIDELEKGLSGTATSPSGLLRVTSPSLFGRAFVLPIATAFLRQHSAISLDLMFVEREVDLIAENVHVAIRVGEVHAQSLTARRLGDLRWVFCAAPDYLAGRKAPQSLDDLDQHDCLIFSPDGEANSFILPMETGSRRLGGRTRLRSNTIDTVIAAARAGCGVAWVPEWAAQPQLKAGELVLLLEPHTPPPRPVFALFTHRNMLAEKVRAFIDFTAERLADKVWMQ